VTSDLTTSFALIEVPGLITAKPLRQYRLSNRRNGFGIAGHQQRGVATGYRWAWRLAVIAQCVVDCRIKRQDGGNS
jgi:hypothetical protein